MVFHEIELAANDGNWRLFMVRKADKAFLTFQEKIFDRDHYTCQYCGFRSKNYMEVVNLDGNYANNKKNNLVTACPFCTQCFFLESVGKGGNSGGSLIILPEITQGELNAFCHTLFIALFNQTTFTAQAKNLYRSLRLRSQQVEKHLGEGLSNPALYGQLLIDTSTEAAQKIKHELSPTLRLLPDITQFGHPLDVWSQEGLTCLSS